mgnify:FL=1
MKSRVRMIVVLVCVFVVLPVVGGLVYSFSVSAEAAARYYAEAIAQGRFEDAMGVESDEADKGSGIELGGVVDLRQGHFVAPNSVGSVRVYPELDVWGRQGASIDLSVNGRTITREIYLERVGVPRPHVGMWRVVSGAAQVETVRAYGYASDVRIGGVSLGRAGATSSDGVAIPAGVSADGVEPQPVNATTVYAYPGVYEVAVDKVSEHTDVLINSEVGASSIELAGYGSDKTISVMPDDETRAWFEGSFDSLARSCFGAEAAQGALCPTFDFSGTVTDEVEEKVWWQTDGLDGLETVWIKTDADVVSVDLAGALCFDEAGDARVMFRVGKEFHYPPNS